MIYKITTTKNMQTRSYFIIASSKDKAFQVALQKDGIEPLSVKDIFTKKPSTKDIIASLYQMSIMLEANLPINHTLETIIKSIKSKSLKSIYQDIYQSVQSGLSLSEAFRFHKETFGSLCITMIALGSQSGNLPYTLKLLINQLEYSQKIKKEVKKALSYPCFVFICVCVCFGALLLFVMPQFLEFFKQGRIELPIYTKALIFTEQILREYYPYLILLIALIPLLLKFKILNNNLISMALSLPLIGGILRTNYLYQYTLTLSILLKSNIDLAKSIELANTTIDSNHIKTKLQKAQEAVLSGRSLSYGLECSKLFDSFSIGLIRAGEESGEVNSMLELCSREYQSNLKESIDGLIAMLEPTLTVFMAVCVLFLALGIFMPMWDLNLAF